MVRFAVVHSDFIVDLQCDILFCINFMVQLERSSS